MDGVPYLMCAHSGFLALGQSARSLPVRVCACNYIYSQGFACNSEHANGDI